MLNQNESRQLQHFVRIVYEMKYCRFIQTCLTQDHSVKHDGSHMTYPHYDAEDLRSFLTSFRQVAMSVSESVYLTKVFNTVSKHSDNDERSELKKLKNHLFPLLNGKYPCIRFGSEGTQYTAFELLNILVNGSIFHVFEKYEEAVAFLNSQNLGMYLGIILGEFIFPVLRDCWFLLCSIKRCQLIDDRHFRSKDPDITPLALQ